MMMKLCVYNCIYIEYGAYLILLCKAESSYIYI